MRLDVEPETDRQKLDAAIARSKAAFRSFDAMQRTTWPEFFYRQSRTINRRWWLMQGALLLLLWLILVSTDSSWEMRRSIGVFSPAFVVLIMPELWKNRAMNAMEVECTTYYTLRQVYAVRMICFGLVDLLLLSLFFAAASVSVQMQTLELVMHFFVPFNVTCCICFRTLYVRRTWSEYQSVLLCLGWVVVWTRVVVSPRAYEAVFAPAWWAMLILSFIYLGCCVMQAQRKCEEVWEAETQWN